MKRNRYVGYLSQTQHGYLVAFDMFWTVLESRRIDPALGAPASLLGFLQEYAVQGWVQENSPRYGCAFMHRAGIRILLEATPRDPMRRGSQTFSPYRSGPIVVPKVDLSGQSDQT